MLKTSAVIVGLASRSLQANNIDRNTEDNGYPYQYKPISRFKFTSFDNSSNIGLSSLGIGRNTNFPCRWSSSSPLSLKTLSQCWSSRSKISLWHELHSKKNALTNNKWFHLLKLVSITGGSRISLQIFSFSPPRPLVSYPSSQLHQGSIVNTKSFSYRRYQISFREPSCLLQIMSFSKMMILSRWMISTLLVLLIPLLNCFHHLLLLQVLLLVVRALFHDFFLDQFPGRFPFYSA